MNERPASATRPWLTGLLLLLAVGIPLAAWFGLDAIPPQGAERTAHSLASHFDPYPQRLEVVPIGPLPEERPRITNLQIVDLDGDQQADILACDAVRNRILWYRASGDAADSASWQERDLGGPLPLTAPGHATVVDLDQDQDLDILVAGLGSLWPTNDRVGRVVWLENQGDLNFQSRVLMDDVRRISDVQAGDLDADGDLDLVVAEFGFDHGRVLWLENHGEQQFEEHLLLDAPGPIHVPIGDFDGDGDLDVVTVVTQEEEEVWGFENVQEPEFALRPRRLHWTMNYDLGAAGLIASDLDQDGDLDLLMSAGDNLELAYHYPQPYHGCIWLENRGGWKFEPRQISTLGGTYAAATGDMDADGDLDVAVVSMFNDWHDPNAASVVWLENDGKQNFRTWQVASRPTSLCTVASGDLNGDGRADIVAGGLYLKEPFDRIGRITSWISPAESRP